MKHLLNTLYVLSEDSYLSLNGENVVVSQGENQLGRFPLHTLENILCFSYKGASPALLGACVKRGIHFCFFTPNGRFLARVCGETSGSVLLRQQQSIASMDPVQTVRFAKNLLMGKVYNSRWVLERATRDHPQRVPVEALKAPENYKARCFSCKTPKASMNSWAWKGKQPRLILAGWMP